MLYIYIALDKNDRRVRGKVEAQSMEETLKILEENQYEVLNIYRGSYLIESIKKILLYQTINRDLVIRFTKQFQILENSGIGILHSLEIIEKQSKNKRFGRIINELKTNVQKGISLSESMEGYEYVFSPFYISMIKIGEVSGNFNPIFSKLIIHLERERNIKNKVKAAAMYPIILLVVTILVVVFILIGVLPTFLALYEGREDLLPGATKVLVAISQFLINNYVEVILFTILWNLSFFILLKIEQSSRLIEMCFSKLPVVGKEYLKIESSKFVRSLSILLSSGIPILIGIDISRETVKSRFVSNKLKGVTREISRGEPISSTLEGLAVFPDIVIQMINIGEESGTLDNILVKTSDILDYEIDIFIEKTTSLIEPILILIMSIIVGFVVISMVMPMYDVINTI